MIINFGSMGNDFLVPSGKHLPQPGETIVSKESFVHTPGGGKGMNQAVAAARAGAQVKMAGKIGKDDYGQAVMDTLEQENVSTDLIETDPAIKTGVAFIFVDSQGNNSIINSAGANLQASQEIIPDNLLGPQTLVMIQMEVDYNQNWDLVHRAKSKGSKVMLNVAPADQVPVEVLEKLDYLVVNEIEAGQIAQTLELTYDKDDYSSLARKISEKCDLACIITLGEMGLVAFKDEQEYQKPAFPLDKVVDTTGAGDAFCGGFAASLDTGYSFEDALLRGNITGGLACTEIGCQVALPLKAEIDRYAQDVNQKKAG